MPTKKPAKPVKKVGKVTPASIGFRVPTPDEAIAMAMRQKSRLNAGPRLAMAASRSMMSDIVSTWQLQQHTGQSAKPSEGGNLTADTLRVLDSGREHPGFADLPRWLVAAGAKAARELAEWYPARGLPRADEPDPGDPSGKDATFVDFPLPDPAMDADRRLVEYCKCRRDFVYFVDNYLNLRDRERGVVPFRLWPWQAWLGGQYLRHPRIIELKARQIGCSELVAAYAIWRITFFDSQDILFLSMNENEAVKLLGRAKLMYSFMPAWLQAGTPESLSASHSPSENTKRLLIPHVGSDGRERVSVIESLPATEGAGRGRSATLVVLDEWAHEQWAEQIWAAIEPTIDSGGQLIGLSSANGIGGTFYDTWQGAATKDREHQNGFFGVFLSWRRHPARDDKWYAAKKRATPEWQLHQEFPSEASEAFRQSGNTVFDSSYLVEHETRIDAELTARAADGLPAWEEVDGLTIYEEPVAGHRYVIGADCAEGRGDGDFDAAVVIDRDSDGAFREVASLYGKWTFEVYSRKLDALGRRFNNAHLAVERNNHGHAILEYLQNGLSYSDGAAGERRAYPNIYHHKDALVAGRHQDQRPGWHTNIATKPAMIDALAVALREHSYQFRSKELLYQALIYQFTPTGYASAPPNSSYHDDMVMASAIAVFIVSRPDMVAHTLDYVRKLQEQVQGRIAALQVNQGSQRVQPNTPLQPRLLRFPQQNQPQNPPAQIPAVS